jgi:ribosomal protein S18 acetylase RimI-like enzyme
VRDLIDIVENAQMAMIAEAQSAADRFIDRANATIKDRELRLALWAEDYDEVSIQRLSVDPYFRGMGIATAALRKLCQMA